MVLGNGVPVLKEILARWDGKHASTFATEQTYTYIAEKTRTDDRPASLLLVHQPH